MIGLLGAGSDLSSSLDIGLGVGTPSGDPAPVVADPRTEYVASAGAIEVDRGFLAIEDSVGGPLAWHGVRVYQQMIHTPVVGSSFNALRAGTLSNPVNLLPAVRTSTSPGPSAQQAGSNVEADMAAEIATSNRRLLEAWETPLPMVLWEMMEAMYLGHTLAEIVADDVEGGPDDGLLAIKAIKPKPRSTYQFRVDRANNVVAIKAQTFDAEGRIDWQAFDPGHFAWLTWDPHRGDPRGRSCFRMAHYHWRLLMDLWPEVWKGWQQFGTPWVYGTTAPGAKMVTPLDKAGNALPGKGVTAEAAAAGSLQQMRNGKVAVGPNGSDAKILESGKDSSIAAGGIGLLEGQIVRSILLQMMATVEAKHSSKAHGEIGQDIMGTLVRVIRMWLERFLRSLLIRQNTWNYGEDIARRLTPIVDLGGTEHQDFSANAAGVGVLYQASYFTASQLPYVDTFLGLPQRQPGDARVGPTGVVPDVSPVDPNAAAAPDPALAAGGAA
jgi:hypothetical protein